MVQLIRLTTDDNNAYFNNTFNQDIVIERNSKIALKNLSCEVNVNVFDVNFSNNVIKYQMREGNIKTVYLSKGTYTKSNINDLFQDMQNKLNQSLSLDGAEYGKQWEVTTNDAVLNIKTEIGKKAEYTNEQIRNNIMLRDNGIYSSDGEEDELAFLTIHKSICKGSGTFFCKINDKGTGYIVIGLVEKQYKQTDVINLEDIKYGISYNPDTNKYTYFIDGGEIQTNLDVSNNEYMYIIIEEGQVKLKIYRSASDDTLYTSLYTLEDLYPILIIEGDAQAERVRFTPDPFYTDLSIYNIELNDEVLLTAPKPSQVETLQFFEFDSTELADFLGFKNKRIPTNGTLKQFNFDIKSLNLNPSDLSESYIVELLNIPLLSFNADKKQRQNILDTIVNTEITNDRLAYTAPYPLYINLDNSDKIILRNIKAQILKEDGSPVTINGFAQMTLLIM